MKKTISLLALMMLFSTYCLAQDYPGQEPYEIDPQYQSEMMIHAIDCNEWINAIPDDIDPIHIDPADQLDLRYEDMEWDDDNIHFNYLLHPATDEACFRQASLRFRQHTGHNFGERYPGCTIDIYTWIWCCENVR